MSDQLQQVPTAQSVDSVPVEVQRIMRTGTIWTAAGVLAPVIGLGPLVAAGWRPADLTGGVELVFWLGTLVATAGLGLLMWAGCPVMAYTVEQAYWQKKHSIRIGICMNLLGMALVGLVVLLSPAVG
ncbi:hypothetical protein [Agrococcus sp. SGAir0287]|uniref:hypothetical protein n=1 Tax=Agrococcus sp. SGAir0287 TaxID=2070347 RepID=UPI0010F963A6|nr:hypothetical protein [Agrococcus sp. SGAir0287]